MFSQKTYNERRSRLKREVGSGLILLLGLEESPINFAHNTYPFRQDSSFLYFFGLNRPGLNTIIDIDENREILFGDDLNEESVIWTVPQQNLSALGEQVGIEDCRKLDCLEDYLKDHLGKRILHFLPTFRHDQKATLSRLLNTQTNNDSLPASETLTRAVINQRSYKTEEEIAEIEKAIMVSNVIHTSAMKISRPKMFEYEAVGLLEGMNKSLNSRPSFQTIFTVHGEILHNPSYDNQMKAGDLVVHDSGAESPNHYAGDITRTFPVNGKFTDKQREVYTIVLHALEVAMNAVKPGVEFRSIHRLAGKVILEGLANLGIIKGNPEEAVEADIHTLFFPCGLGHMMGLDVHDMESLGEDYVGYNDLVRRNPNFGWRNLRLGKALESGNVITIEPGIYFNPRLTELWKSAGKGKDFVNYSALESYFDFGGIRIEDDILVADQGYRLLGPAIPKTIDEIEETCRTE
ncbi:MAG TPA: aminopeptidase P family protein [Verrucomicrobiales bacterium]|nr:aminopeptidase P family protein [Verrucomicrobiales bacterium]